MRTRKLAVNALLPASKARRGIGRPWPKGISGNPAGLPKAIGELRKLAQTHTPEAIDALVTALKDKNGVVRVRAAEALLDRAWGKPTQAVDLDVTACQSTVPIEDLPTETLKAMLAEQLAAEGKTLAEYESRPPPRRLSTIGTRLATG